MLCEHYALIFCVAVVYFIVIMCHKAWSLPKCILDVEGLFTQEYI